MYNNDIFNIYSTPSQVIDTAEKMNAEYTIGTHFSKRYLAIPVFPECSHRHIACAFDFMKVGFFFLFNNLFYPHNKKKNGVIYISYVIINANLKTLEATLAQSLAISSLFFL